MSRLRLTELLGRPVVDGAGRRLGRVRDVVIDCDDAPPVVAGLVVGGRGRVRFASWDTVRLNAGAVHTAALTRTAALPDRHGSWLRDDVLDAQILDGDGHRAGRVGDLVLALEGGKLSVLGAEVGLVPVLRRLGLGALSRAREPEWVPWPAMTLRSSRPGVLAEEHRDHGRRFGTMRRRRHAPS